MLHAVRHSFPFSGVSLPSPVLAQPGDTQDSSSSRANLSVHWEPSTKVLGDVLTAFPNMVHHPAQDSRNTTAGKGDLGLLHGAGAKSSIPQAMA